MKKFLLLICALTGTVGARAATSVTVIDKTLDASTYGSLSGTTFTTNETSGMANVTIDGITWTGKVNDNYGYCLGVTNSQTGTVTITAPAGYVVMGYTLTVRLNTSQCVYTLTPSAGGSAITGTTGGTVLSASGLDAQAASFTYSAPSANTFYIPSMTITIGTIDEATVAKQKIEAFNTAHSWITTIQNASGLVKDGNNYYSNAKEASEGSYAALVDDDYTTFFHSTWNNGPDEDHYLQATLPEHIDNAFYFYFKKRAQNNANRPTSITISGSSDGMNFHDITTINSGLPTADTDIDYLSDKISFIGPYKYFRFTVTATNTGAASNNHVFFTFSEFWMLPSNSDTDNALSLLKTLPTTALDLTDQQISEINAANTALLNTIVNVTYELYEADGTTLVSSETVEQNKNSSVNIPTSMSVNSSYFDYSTIGTIGTTDCTIKITRTPMSGIIYPPYTNLSNSKSYYIKTRYNNRGALSTYTDNGTTYLASPAKSDLGVSAKKFAIISYEENYYLYSVEDEKFVTYQSNEIAPLADVINGTSDRISLTAATAPLYEILFDGRTSKIINSSASYTYGLVMNSWGSSSNQWDDGCLYSIEEAGDFDPTEALAALEEFFHPSTSVKFVISDANGVVFTSDNIAANIGETITELPAEYQRDFCTYTVTSTTIAAGENIVNVDVSYSGFPFDLCSSYASATWYNMNIRGTKYVSKSETEPYALATATTAEKAEDAYCWAFSGNPYAFVVYNKASGEGFTLKKDGDNAVMREGTYTWTLCKNGDGFTLKVTGTDYTYVNDVNSTLKFWNDAQAATDNGSTFRVETVVDNYYDMVKAEVLPYIFANTEDLVNSDPAASIGKPFGIKLETAEYIVETYGAQLFNQNFNLTDYQAIVGVKDEGIIYPENGKFYLIKNVSNGKYLNVKSDHGIYADADTPTASSIVQAIVREDKTYFATQGLEFGWCYTASYPALLDATGSGKYAYFSPTAPGQVAFAHVLGNGEGSTYEVYTPLSYYTVADNNQVVGGTANAAAAQWTFEEATDFTISLDGPINDNYYATLCVPFDVTIEGATAYTITKGTGNVLTTTEVEGTIAAGTPVLLIGSSNSATATIAEDAAYSSAISTETALTGSYLEVAGLDGAINYVLGKDESKAGFFHTEGTTLTTNSAYLAGDESTSAIEAFYFDLDSTDLVGDVNGDGGVTIADVTALVNIILGKDDVEPYQYNHDAADVNGDKSVTIADVTALVNIILGKNN